jgi:hypothetical protein
VACVSHPSRCVQILCVTFCVTEAVVYFQTQMERIFAKLLYERIRVYLDDLAVKSSSARENLKVLREVFLICRESRVSLKLAKCQFFALKCKYLGHLFANGSLKPNLGNPNVRLCKRRGPKFSQRSLLALLQYFSRFLDHLADEADSLRSLTKKVHDGIGMMIVTVLIGERLDC